MRISFDYAAPELGELSQGAAGRPGRHPAFPDGGLRYTGRHDQEHNQQNGTHHPAGAPLISSKLTCTSSIVRLHHQVGELVRDSEELIMFINVMLSEGFEGHQGHQVQ